MNVLQFLPALILSLVVSLGTSLALRPAEPAGAKIVSRTVNQFVPYAEERVIDLPEDGNQWHTSLFLRPEWQSLAAERKAEAMFHSEPLLVSLKHQTHWHLTTTDSAEFQKFAALVDATPCLLIQRANGQVVYRESGPELGRQPHALTHAIRKEIQRHCPDGRCLPVHPIPGPPEPPEEIPTIVSEPAASDKKNPLAGVLMGLAALAGGAAAHWKKTG